MKKYLVTVLTAVFLVTSSALANKEALLVEKAQVNYENGLDNNIGSVVESAIFNVMVLKQQYPQYDFSEIVEKLNRLSKESKFSVVRNKAFLAVSFFNDTDLSEMNMIAESKNSDRVFNEIARNIAIRNKIKFINR